MQIVDLIRERGPVTVAAFMDLALYHPEFGYYARAAQRSGRAGDFFTSVDVGPLFGELLEIQLAEMAASASNSPFDNSQFDIVEAGAGNGRLAADILRAARRRDPAFYDRIRLHLVEASAAARAAQPATLGEVGDRLASSGAALPASFEGALVANELLDALPVHQVVMTRRRAARGVRRRRRGDAPRDARGPASTPAPCRRTSIAPARRSSRDGGRRSTCAPLDWIRDASRRLSRGFLILIDYGHLARDLYSASHAGGTLTTFARHTMAGPESGAGAPAWLAHPGEQDLTAHVDFTSVRAAAEAEGLVALGLLDQTYFLMGLVAGAGVNPNAGGADLKRSLALKTLLMPGGLGSTHKVLDPRQGRRRAGARRLLVPDAAHMTGIVIGLAAMIVSEAATLARVEPFASWNTPICWTASSCSPTPSSGAGAATRG